MRGEENVPSKQRGAASLLGPTRKDLLAARAPQSRLRNGEIEMPEDTAKAALVTVSCPAVSANRDCSSLVDRCPQLRQDLENR
jgi:hypothetical protein